MHCFIEFSKNFKEGRRQIVFSIVAKQQSLATDRFERLNLEQLFYFTIPFQGAAFCKTS